MPNREIKFKFWDLDAKKWIAPSEIEFCSDPDSVNTNYYIGVPFNLYGKNVEYCQFAGLTDKDGKEIYEGDIVKIKGFKAVWGRSNLNKEYLNGCKVLGNIFENSDLLK